MTKFANVNVNNILHLEEADHLVIPELLKIIDKGKSIIISSEAERD